MGDLSHVLSKIIITTAIHMNQSAEGVSWITQVLYTIVFLSRYTDLFDARIIWNLTLKWFYILSSIYIVFIMRFWFPRTREREFAWKLGGIVLISSLFISPFAMLIFHSRDWWGFYRWLWDFSEILESVCVLPQLLLLRQTTVPTVINSFYLLTLGSYRALYILNWIQRWSDPEDSNPQAISVIFGIVQTALYVDFAWVYWGRQRVKLRNGGIIDGDDFRRGWLVNRLLGRTRLPNTDEDEENAPALGSHRSTARATRSSGNKWASRGISISADDDTLDVESGQHEEGVVAGPVDPDARMQDPEELARALNESSSEEDSDDSNDNEEDDDSNDSDDSKDSKNTPKQTAAGAVDAGTSAWRS